MSVQGSGFSEVAFGFEGAKQVAAVLPRVAGLLGGDGVLHCRVEGALDTHDLLVGGLPGEALTHLVDRLTVLQGPGYIEKAIGIGVRTVQRRREEPGRLSAEQSGRTWKFAEILTRATGLMGSQEAAERWMLRPAMGLDGRCPIDLLGSPAGVEIVEEFLTRLEFGVYT